MAKNKKVDTSLHIKNEIVLRPRFQLQLLVDKTTILKAFKEQSQQQNEFIVKQVGDHVFIKQPKNKEHFWSPQLHLEINEIDNSSCKVYGLFGPNPSIWLFFMFLHFAVAVAFICFSVWMYTSWSLNKPYTLPLLLALAMVAVWFLLYFSGRMGKAKGKNEMQKLYYFMTETINL